MKRYVVKRLPEKVVMATIILSCGLVMQAPTAKSLHGKSAGSLPHNYAPSKYSAHHLRTTHPVPKRDQSLW